MRASKGVWHTGAPENGRVQAFQLWVALPPELENAPYASHYVMPKDVPSEGLVLGNYSVHTSAEALLKSETEIRRIGEHLRANGTIK